MKTKKKKLVLMEDIGHLRLQILEEFRNMKISLLTEAKSFKIELLQSCAKRNPNVLVNKFTQI